MRRTNMLKAREILRLKYESALSLRDIAIAAGCGKTTVAEVLERAVKANISWPPDLSDKQLLSLLYPPLNSKKELPEPDMSYIFYELKKKGVTLMLLWEEYKEAYPEGLMYTQFCTRYREFKKSLKLSMHIEHKAGIEMQVDWAGQEMAYFDTATGEIVRAFIFVTVLPASAYPFVYAYKDKKLENYIDAHVRAFEYFGGVPKILVPDNEKTAITVPNNINPVLNRSYSEMAKHYHTAVVPARSARPKDKAADENMVGNVSRRILAPLRNKKFFSMLEINDAIACQLEKFITRPFAKMEGNRATAFKKIDKPALQQLPTSRYEYCDWKESRIAFNYHVDYDGFYYSTDESYRGQLCSIRATKDTIEIFIDNIRIAAHARNYNKFAKYTTLPEHMPDAHKAVSGWSSDRFISWAESIGPNTKNFIRHLLSFCEYPVQAYRSCMAILNLAKNSETVMEKASAAAIDKNVYSFKYFEIIFKQEKAKSAREAEPPRIIAHNNIRGRSAFTGGGINA